MSPSLIARVFPTNPVASVFAALVAAFLLPVCDCSAVPIFRSLLRKGVPLSAATTLMLASPAINPLVIASTYYAFGSWSLVVGRIGLSIIVALTVGLSMLVSTPRALREDHNLHEGDTCGCEGGCAVRIDRSRACWARRATLSAGFSPTCWAESPPRRLLRSSGRCRLSSQACRQLAHWRS